MSKTSAFSVVLSALQKGIFYLKEEMFWPRCSKCCLAVSDVDTL